MDRPEILDFFTAEAGKIIEQHIKHIKTAINEYDVVIFMARKSVCLFRAFIKNKEIEKPREVTLLSSRSLTYNVIKKLKNKRVAVVDDVVVFGKSVSRVMKLLEENSILADVYIIACEKGRFEGIEFTDRIADNWQYLSKEEIHQISEQITEYIAASGISYNIDQPIYNIRISSNDKINIIKLNHNIQEVSDGLQQEYGISSFSIHFNSSIIKNVLNINLMNEDPIVKIRFIYKDGDKYVTAIPFVLLPEMKKELIGKLYKDIIGEKYDQYIGDGDFKIANELKLLQYSLSEQLLELFSLQNGIDIRKEIFNEKMIFSFQVDNKYNCPKLCECNLSYENEINVSRDRFLLDEWISASYFFLREVENLHDDSLYKEVGNDPDAMQHIITYKRMKSWLEEVFDEVNIYIVSVIADIFIDKGILIPILLENIREGTIVRGFKLGEIFHLTKEAMDLFQYMLYQYQKLQEGRLIDRTEYEKLCVLFLRKVGYGEKSILSRRKKYGDDNFSICYTRFGPRVSDSKRVLEVSKYSTLANRMEMNGIIETKTNGLKYKVNEPTERIKESWKICADNFALSYSSFRKHYGRSIPKREYFKSFNDLITILAIGNSSKDKLFSLAAELNLFTKIDLCQSISGILHQMYHTVSSEDPLERPRKFGVMDGIQSGIWKYMCFKQKALVEGVFSDSVKADSSLRYLYEDYLRDEGDTNDAYYMMIDKCGELLFRIAACYNRLAYAKEDRFYFTTYLYNNSTFEKYRKEISILNSEEEIFKELQKLQRLSKVIIDKCNIISETGANVINNLKGIYNIYPTSFLKEGQGFIIGEGNKSWYLEESNSKNEYASNQGFAGIKPIRIVLDDELLSISESGTIHKATNVEEIIEQATGELKLLTNATAIIYSDFSDSTSIRYENEDSIGKTNNTIYIGGVFMKVEINNTGNVGNMIVGDTNNVNQLQTIETNIDYQKIRDAIQQIDLNSIPEIIREEFKEEQQEAIHVNSDNKMKEVLKKIGTTIGKISYEAAKTVFPKLLMAELQNGGFIDMLK